MKKIIILFFLLFFVLYLCACSEKCYDYDNISELYDKEYIVGKTREEIETKYGEFDREFVSDNGENVGSYYVNYDNSGIDPSYIHDTYFVVFNDNDMAIDAFFRETSIGG